LDTVRLTLNSVLYLKYEDFSLNFSKAVKLKKLYIILRTKTPYAFMNLVT